MKGICSLFNSHRVWSSLPLLFIFAISFAVFPSYHSAYATYETGAHGFITGNVTDYDGFLAGDASGQASANWQTYGAKKTSGAFTSPNGLQSQFPILCRKANGSTISSCSANATIGGRMHEFLPARLTTPANNTLDYYAFSKLQLLSASTIPSDWYGKKVVLTWYLDISETTGIDQTTGEMIMVHRPSWLSLNWGAMDLTDSKCQVEYSYIHTPWSDNDFISYELDYTNITDSTCTQTYPTLTSGASNKALFSNFSDYDLYVGGNTYLAYDFMDSQTEDALEGIMDDWKQQQSDEWNEEMEIINDNKDSMSGSLSALGFNFSVPNPFRAFFSGVTNACSVSIPTLSSWIGSPSSTYPSWWCRTQKLQGIRSALTVIVSFSAVVILFGAVYHWLNNTETY